MNTSQIIVRSKLLPELAAAKDSGIRHGKFTLVTSADVEAEIERRRKHLTPYRRSLHTEF